MKFRRREKTNDRNLSAVNEDEILANGKQWSTVEHGGPMVQCSEKVHDQIVTYLVI